MKKCICWCLSTLYLIYDYRSGLSSNQTFRKETTKYVSIRYWHKATGGSETIEPSELLSKRVQNWTAWLHTVLTFTPTEDRMKISGFLQILRNKNTYIFGVIFRSLLDLKLWEFFINLLCIFLHYFIEVSVTSCRLACRITYPIQLTTHMRQGSLVGSDKRYLSDSRSVIPVVYIKFTID